MTPFEWLAAAYFAVLLFAAASRRRSSAAIAFTLGAIALVIVARITLPWPARAWMPHVYLLVGYWIPAAFVRARNARFERWLVETDARLAAPISAVASRIPHSILELAYLCCYPLVPAAFAVVFLRGASQDVVRFWMATLAAGYACYISLPWAAALPPRLADAHPAARPSTHVASVNALVLGRLSHQLVTFPSGHVAVSCAAAAGVWRVSPPAGAVFAVTALLIATAAVAGRYHYAIDVLLGIAVGALAAVAFL